MRAIQGRSVFEYSLLFFCLRLKLKKRIQRELKAKRDKKRKGKVLYINDPLRVIWLEKGECWMTERGIRGKIQRHRRKSKNIICSCAISDNNHLKIRLRKNRFRERERVLLTQQETTVEMSTLPQGAVCWTLKNVKSNACHHWKRKHFHFINCLSKGPCPNL